MRAVAWALALLAVLMHAPAALAHASLIRSEPPDRAVVARAPDKLTLIFNEPVSPLSLRLVGEGGHTLELDKVASDGATLTAILPGRLPQGTHLLSFRVISADGHPVAGSLSFSVGRPSAGALPAQVEPDRALRLSLWLARLVLYAGLFAGVGGAFYASFVVRGPLDAGVRRIVAAALECGLVAAVIAVGLQGVDVQGLTLGALNRPDTWASGLATSYGMTAIMAAIALVLGRVALEADGRAQRTMSIVALSIVGAALAASGHASAAPPQWLTRPAVFLHGVAVAFWIGALLPLMGALRAGRVNELARFSRAVPLPLAVLIATGSALAVIQLRQIDALWSTGYGLVLSAKLALVLLVLALAAANRRQTPEVLAGDAGGRARIVRAIRVELLLVAVILALVASWRFTPPPRSTLAAADQPVHAHIHTDKAMADLAFGPARPGGRTITLVLLDGQFGPLAAREVTLFLSRPEAGIEQLRLPAVHVEATIWRIEGAPLPAAAGRWHAQVDILVGDFDRISIEDDIDLPR